MQALQSREGMGHGLAGGAAVGTADPIDESAHGLVLHGGGQVLPLGAVHEAGKLSRHRCGIRLGAGRGCAVHLSPWFFAGSAWYASRSVGQTRTQLPCCPWRISRDRVPLLRTRSTAHERLKSWRTYLICNCAMSRFQRVVSPVTVAAKSAGVPCPSWRPSSVKRVITSGDCKEILTSVQGQRRRISGLETPRVKAWLTDPCPAGYVSRPAAGDRLQVSFTRLGWR